MISLSEKSNLNFLHLKIILLLIISSLQIFGQGKLLRGEKWQKYNVDIKKADFFVAPDGNDMWSGTLAEADHEKNDGPFRTIERAQQAVRELKNKVYTPEEKPIEINYIGSPHTLGDGKDILVLIRGGFYSLEKPLTFLPDDGGERVETNLPSGAFEYHKLKDYYVTYAAYPGERPIISGGVKISSWKKNEKYWTADAVNLSVNSFIVDGKTQTLARTPNDGFYVFSKASENTGEFTFNEGELKNWPDMENNRIRMYLRWHYGINSIERIDESKNIAYLKKPQDGILVISPRYYVENVKALLDEPNEWYYENTIGKLYFIPPDSLDDPNLSNTVVPRLSNIITIEGSRERPVRNLRFYGLSLEATTSGKSLFSMQYSNNCEIVNSKINSAGGIGIYIGLGCFQSKILNNKIIQTGNSAVRVDGVPYPESWSDLIRETIISENYIEQAGGTSVSVRNTLYTTISHNEITDNQGRTCIYVGGWANLEEAVDGGNRIEYNHIYDAQSLADDSGVITTGGYTYDSIIRGNLIHDVKKGRFNDNVAIWFDNMSSGWIAESNIFYNLEQGDMKLCAANLVDNIYRNNFRIPEPKIPPEGIIMGQPELEFSNLEIVNAVTNNTQIYNSGDIIKISVNVKNKGATGVGRAESYVNGKVHESKFVPLIRNNISQISFDYLLTAPGTFRFAIGNSEVETIQVDGYPISLVYDSISVSSEIIPVGDEVNVTAVVSNVSNNTAMSEAKLSLNNNVIASKVVELNAGADQSVEFNVVPEAGNYSVRIGNSKSAALKVYPYEKLDLAKIELSQYCDSRAEPHSIKIDQINNEYNIEAAGTDFFHGEDSYASVFLSNPIKGNFVAKVKVAQFGERTHEWFRAGLFARNDITKSFGTGMGSKGSVLMFVSPGRAGMNWDEHGDGCMHRANSENHPVQDVYPMWIKLERKGNRFSGYVSYDGKNWIVSRHTEDLPGLNESIHIGLAAGGPDQRVYSVSFTDFEILVEK